MQSPDSLLPSKTKMPPTNGLEYNKYVLKEELGRYVKYCWIMKSHEVRSEKDLLIPDGYPEIIFVRKGAYQKELLLPNSKSQIIDKSCVIGIQSQTVLASRMDHCSLIGLKLTPIGAYALFGSHLNHFQGANCPIAELGVTWLSNLDRNIQNCQDTAVVDLLSTQLTLQLHKAVGNRKLEMATSYLDTILQVQGRINISELAKRHFVSVRQYQRNFSTFFGVSPKTFLNIIRFKQFYKSSTLQQKAPKNFLEYGYYDQTHFIKDFKKHLGISPSKSSNSLFLQMNEIARTSL